MKYLVWLRIPVLQILNNTRPCMDVTIAQLSTPFKLIYNLYIDVVKKGSPGPSALSFRAVNLCCAWCILYLDILNWKTFDQECVILLSILGPLRKQNIIVLPGWDVWCHCLANSYFTLMV